MKTYDLKQNILSIFKETEHHGYDLHRLLKMQNITIGTSRLYSILDEMKEDGLLSDRWEKSDAGPKKRIYSLSEKGHQARLETLLQAIDVVHEFYVDYLQKLPATTNLFTNICKKLASQVPADGNIVCLFSEYTSPVEIILRGLKDELPLATFFLINPEDSRHHYPDGWQALPGRCDDIPLRNGFVDLLFITGYENEFAEKSCLKEWRRVLGEDGQFSLVTANTKIDELTNPLSIGQFIETFEHQSIKESGSSTWTSFKKKLEKLFPSIQQTRMQDISILRTSQ